jgi:DNA-binding CsgD family transcriptional regulator
MNESEYRRLRADALSGGEPAPAIMRELRGAAGRLLASRVLPPALSPYGVWNQEAADDVFQAWAAERLFGRGDLRGILARAGNLPVLRALAERSLRQFLLNARGRSEAQNLYGRVREQLAQDQRIRRFIESPRSQNAWWGLSDWDQPPAFNDDQRSLNRAAWSIEDLTVIRYASDARKLSPMLDRDELNRFLHSLFQELQAMLTLTHIMSALRERLALDYQRGAVSIDVAPEPAGSEDTATELALRQTALLVISELTSRQAKVLLQTSQGRPLAAIAQKLGCSAATALNEQRRIATAIRRLSADQEEQGRVLNVVTDLLYVGGTDALD